MASTISTTPAAAPPCHPAQAQHGVYPLGAPLNAQDRGTEELLQPVTPTTSAGGGSAPPSATASGATTASSTASVSGASASITGSVSGRDKESKWKKLFNIGGSKARDSGIAAGPSGSTPTTPGSAALSGAGGGGYFAGGELGHGPAGGKTTSGANHSLQAHAQTAFLSSHSSHSVAGSFANEKRITPSTLTDGSSSINLPLTPGSTTNPSFSGSTSHGHSTSTTRSSDSSRAAGILLAGGGPHSNGSSPAPSKGRFLSLLDGSGVRHKNKAERYKTLGRVGASTNAPSGATGAPPKSPSSRANLGLGRNGTAPVLGTINGQSKAEPGSATAANGAQPSEPTSATQRLLRRVASAPNAKGLFNNAMFVQGNGDAPAMPPKASHGASHGNGYPSTPDAFSSSPDASLYADSPPGLTHLVLTSAPNGGNNKDPVSPRESGGNIYLTSPKLPTSAGLSPASSTGGSYLSPTTPHHPIPGTSTSGARESRAASASGTSFARIPMSGPGKQAFRRTYSSNSIKTKSVSRCGGLWW